MSLSAVPVFLYGRRLMPPGYALLAAALTVSSPLLLYSGLVMTEVLFYPLSALALLAVARAVETAAKRDQVIALVLIGLAIATRVQAVVFLGVFAGAVGRRRPARPHDADGCAVLAGVARARRPAPEPRPRRACRRLLGDAARQLPDRRLPPPQLLPLRVRHSDGRRRPAGRAAVLFVEASRGRLREPATRALLAVTACATVLVCAQVGFFSARYAPHLLGRNLAPLPPLLFLLFAALARPRRSPPPRRGAATAVLLLAIIVFAPWNSLIVEGPAGLVRALARPAARLGSGAGRIACSGSVLLVSSCSAAPPHRVLPALLLSALIASSALASNMIAERASCDQSVLVGSPRRWIDPRATRPSPTCLNDPDWNVVWQQRFWNRASTRSSRSPRRACPGR